LATCDDVREIRVPTPDEEEPIRVPREGFMAVVEALFGLLFAILTGITIISILWLVATGFMMLWSGL
jgi:hypothetical protein